MNELLNVIDMKTMITLIVSVVGTYYALREKINKAIQKNDDQTNDIQKLSHKIDILNDKREVIIERMAKNEIRMRSMEKDLKKLDNVLGKIEELQATNDHNEKRIQRLENHIDTH